LITPLTAFVAITRQHYTLSEGHEDQGAHCEKTSCTIREGLVMRSQKSAVWRSGFRVSLLAALQINLSGVGARKADLI
jgi:hypothetical protein